MNTKNLMLVDSHCHLDSIEDLEAVIDRAKSDEIDRVITVGTSIESSKKSIEIADSTSLKLRGAKVNIPEIYATVGIHPKDGKSDIEKLGLNQCIHTLKQLVQSSDKVVGGWRMWAGLLFSW